jgi:hypothetical protein
VRINERATISHVLTFASFESSNLRGLRNQSAPAQWIPLQTIRTHLGGLGPRECRWIRRISFSSQCSRRRSQRAGRTRKNAPSVMLTLPLLSNSNSAASQTTSLQSSSNATNSTSTPAKTNWTTASSLVPQYVLVVSAVGPLCPSISFLKPIASITSTLDSLEVVIGC